MVKKLAKILIGLVIIVVLAVVILVMSLGTIAAGAVEKGGSFALGVPVKVDNIDIALMGGTVGVEGLNIGNPEGFEQPHLMDTGRFGLEVESGSVFSDTITVPVIELDGLEVYYVKKGDSDNVKPILANLEKLKGEGTEDEPAAEPAEEKPGKKFIVDRLTITNVTLHLEGIPVLGKKTIHVPKLEMVGLTKDNAKGLAMDELIGRVVPAVLASLFSLEDVTKLVPDLASGLLKQIGNVDELAGQIGSQAGEIAKAALEEGAKVLEGVTEGGAKVLEGAAGDVGKKVTEGIGGAMEGLFGGKKEEKKEE